MSQTMRDDPRLPKRRPLILTFEEMLALEELIDARVDLLKEFLHPQMKKGLQIRSRRLRNIRRKLNRI
jgi:hypothetical protein